MPLPKGTHTLVGFFMRFRHLGPSAMRYAKPPLTVEDQADLLISRGMDAERDLLIERLRVVSYYRLTGYWYPFRKPDPADPKRRLDEFVPGTTFETVWDRYVFDRHLRLLAMDAIERIEVATRTAIAYQHSHAHGPFAYADDPASLPGLDKKDRHHLFGSIQIERGRSKEPFVRHFQAKYGGHHSDLPIWMATEIMSFGSVLTLYRGCPPPIQKAVAAPFGVESVVFRSWLLTLNTIRNICAHHSRLWNRALGVKPMIPHAKHDTRWHDPIRVRNDRAFAILTICKHCMDRVAPQSHWPLRVRELIKRFPQIPTRDMGFPQDWAQCPIWANAGNGGGDG